DALEPRERLVEAHPWHDPLQAGEAAQHLVPLLEGLVFGGVERALAGESEQGQALAERARPVPWQLRTEEALLPVLGVTPQPLRECGPVLDQPDQPVERDDRFRAPPEPRVEACALLPFGFALRDDRRAQKQAGALELDPAPRQLERRERVRDERVARQRIAEREVERQDARGATRIDRPRERAAQSILARCEI